MRSAAAAELTLYLETLCRNTPGLLGTVGQINVPGGAINVVPGRCDLSLDIRSEDESKLARAIADVQARIAQIEQSRGVTIKRHRAAAGAGCAMRRSRCNAGSRMFFRRRRFPSAICRAGQGTMP